MLVESWVDGVYDRGYQVELCEGGGKSREHVVPDSESGQAGYAWHAVSRCKDKEEDLTDVVVALEIV